MTKIKEQNEYAVNILRIQKYKLLNENKDMKKDSFGNSGMSKMVFKGNEECINELQSAIEILQSQGEVIAEGKLCSYEGLVELENNKVFIGLSSMENFAGQLKKILRDFYNSGHYKEGDYIKISITKELQIDK